MDDNPRQQPWVSNPPLAAAIAGHRSRSLTADDLTAVVRYLEDIDLALAMIPSFAVTADPTARFDPAWSADHR